MYQYWLINCYKGTTLAQDVKDRGNCGGEEACGKSLYYMLYCPINKVYYIFKNTHLFIHSEIFIEYPPMPSTLVGFGVSRVYDTGQVPAVLWSLCSSGWGGWGDSGTNYK